MLFKTDAVARAEAKAIRENVGWYRWTHDLIEVTGPDADKWIDYLYVANFEKTVVGKTKYTTMLNEDGKIIDDTIIMHMADQKYWISTLYAPQFLAWADKYSAGYDVAYRDVSLENDMYAIQGPKSTEMVNALVSDKVDNLKRFSWVATKVGDVDVIVHRAGFTGEQGYEIYSTFEDSKKIDAAIREAGKAFDATELTTLEVYVRSIPVEKGFALRQDMYLLTPYECDLGWSVDLNKDFVGKEALEKIKDTPSFKLVGLEYLAESYEDICQMEIVKLNGVPCGRVKAAIYGYTVDKNIGFAVIEADKAVNGTAVTIGQNDSPAIICDKVFM